MRILLFVLLSSTALAQPAMSPPPAPPFSAAMDAPITVGQPGTLEVHPPRSQHKRVLPQTPETRRGPGIWAGDEPTVTLKILDITLPFPPWVAELPAAKECADTYGHLFWALPEPRDEARRLSGEGKMCVMATLFGECLYRAARDDSDAVPVPALDVVDVLMKQCRDIAWSYRDIIRDIETARTGGRPLPKPGGMH